LFNLTKPFKAQHLNAKGRGLLTRRIEAFEEDNAADSYLKKFHDHLCYLTYLSEFK
jgi:hypothetical protein